MPNGSTVLSRLEETQKLSLGDGFWLGCFFISQRVMCGLNCSRKEKEVPVSSYKSYRSTRHLNRSFKALSDPTRRKILLLLGKKGSLTAGEIVGRFSLSQPTISRHLSLLTEVGMVRGKRNGPYVSYSLRRGGLSVPSKFVVQFVKAKKSR